jgi:hypothetical protein
MASRPYSPTTEWDRCRLAGNACYQRGEFREAIPHYTRAIQLNSTESKLFSNRSLCYFKLREYENARRDAERAAELDSNNPKAFYVKGKCHIALTPGGGGAAAEATSPTFGLGSDAKGTPKALEEARQQISCLASAVSSFKRALELAAVKERDEQFGNIFDAYFISRRAHFHATTKHRAEQLRGSLDSLKRFVEEAHHRQQQSSSSSAPSSSSPSSSSTPPRTAAGESSKNNAAEHLGVIEAVYVELSQGPIRWSPFSEIPECFRCPISLEVMRDPVVIAEACDGVSFERRSVMDCFRHDDSVERRAIRHPITRAPLPRPFGQPPLSSTAPPCPGGYLLLPNVTLRSAIESFLESHPWLYDGSIALD